MCGINGVFAFSEKGRRSLEGIGKATEALFKRGPDSGKTVSIDNVALGHRRLSIIDVSCFGDQPMTTADGRFTIAFNGEIFNYQELRDNLTEPERLEMRSHSDTEVFLLLYARLKTAVFSLLRGFFAAAIYDAEEGTLVLVRDRYGKKPLLYYKDDDRLLFASEMKALMAFDIPREIDWNILPVYLQLNYIPQPYSMVKNIQKLLPGHFLTVSEAGIQSTAYYTLRSEPDQYNNYTYDEAQKKLVTLMDEAVRLRLIADVPLGAFLSGGIDSSVIVALASRHTKNLKTFSIGYKDNSFFDETRYAQSVAKRYNTDHTVFSLGNNDFLEYVHDVLQYIDEPFADSSAIPVYILSHLTRKHVTVSLSGDGGDEVFGGYNKHAAEWRIRNPNFLNSAVTALHPLWAALPKSRNGKITNKFRQLYRFSSGSKASSSERYWQWAGFRKTDEAINLLHPDIVVKLERKAIAQIEERYTKDIKGKDFNEVLLADMNLVLLSDMLTKVDLMSMANSLEIRSPFLDAEVVDFAFGLPSSYKINGSLKKRIVQDAFRNLLPPELYNRPKQGFEIPLLGWFRKELRGLIEESLLEDRFVRQQGIFDLSAVQQLKKQLHGTDPGDSHATIWALLVFQHWWKKYFA